MSAWRDCEITDITRSLSTRAHRTTNDSTRYTLRYTAAPERPVALRLPKLDPQTFLAHHFAAISCRVTPKVTRL